MPAPLAFRSRLLIILATIAIVPAVAVAGAWIIGVYATLPRISDAAAWQQVAASGTTLLDSLHDAELSPGQLAVLKEHERILGESLTQANRFRFVIRNSIPLIAIGSVAGLLVLGVAASRVAGHLSRQLSRPINELVGWTEKLAHDQPLPETTTVKGAPEFEILRKRMREMSRELATGRRHAIEAERLEAFRESARRFAHELKNPLTPIQFAVSQLERSAPPDLAGTVDVLRTETQRLDRIARDFSRFGRLPDGPVSDVDVAELVRYTSRATVPTGISLTLSIPEEDVTVRGRHDALQRALSNVLLNAADACGAAAGGHIHVAVERTRQGNREAVAIRVRDDGPGIPPDRIQSVWEPYFTSKAGGTGLGLAIARQAVLAHDGNVEVSCPPGGGTEFRFLIPVNAFPLDGQPSRA